MSPDKAGSRTRTKIKVAKSELLLIKSAATRRFLDICDITDVPT